MSKRQEAGMIDWEFGAAYLWEDKFDYVFPFSFPFLFLSWTGLVCAMLGIGQAPGACAFLRVCLFLSSGFFSFMGKEKERSCDTQIRGFLVITFGRSLFFHLS